MKKLNRKGISKLVGGTNGQQANCSYEDGGPLVPQMSYQAVSPGSGGGGNPIDP